MSSNSILDQILLNQKAEEVARLNAVELINNLFSELNNRERDIVMRRFGLHKDRRDTLENIGKVHNLTRERIRQIETSSVKKLQQLDVLEKHLHSLKKIIVALLEEHGGLMEKQYLLDVLVNFSLNSGTEVKDESAHKNYLNFLITKLLHKEFEEISSSHLLPSYKLKYQDISYMEDLVKELVALIEQKNEVFLTDKIIELSCNLESAVKHSDKLNIPATLDISHTLYNELFEENYNLINANKVLFSVLKAAKYIEQNKFGYWGMNKWREIKPKTINDKIYLVLKNNNEPMHFVEIADRINELSFDSKKANSATVHNELILDDKYILIGRGLYSLKEWGYKKGTVSEVIEEILKENGNKPLERSKIIADVMKRRVVKTTTIILALMNKNKFDKTEEGYRMHI
jgi:hypothetical protein